ncbi:MAG: DEAD/DEAH box helicase [Bacteroidales bacterium]|nr:DEAD/DEAH box helicase [Bacteroidales bacterium]
MIRFDELKLSESVLAAISEMGYVEPSPVQEQTIPFLLENDSDIIALAQTGTGKTAAFGLPAIEKTNLNNKNIQTLILSPTRELGMQIAGELEKFCKNLPKIRIVAVYGGAPIEKQISELNRGAHFVVATPGRMVDLIKRNRIDISAIDRVVLDEADEMLNMGFRDDLDFILSKTPESKCTWLFSATMPREAEMIAKNYMKDPHKITVGAKNAGTDNVHHVYYQVQARDRYLALKRVADINPDIYGIIFCRTRQETKDIAEKLIKDGYNADALHGDLSQAQRDMVMRRFRIKNLQMLVATDVAARGIDVTDLTHVINYNLPDDVENYTHRSGRTGRAGKTGVSISIIHSRENGKIRQIERTLQKKFECAKIPGGKEICEVQLYHLIDKMTSTEVNQEQIEPFMERVMEKIGDLSKEEIVKRFVSAEFSRFLDYYKNAPDLNISVREGGREDRGERRDRGERGERGERTRRDRGERSERGGFERREYNGNFTRFFVSLGEKDGVNKRDLIGIINQTTKNRDIALGKIDVMRNFSFFEADKAATKEILKSFQDASHGDRKLTVEVAEDRAKSSAPRRREGGAPSGDRNRDFGGKRKDFRDGGLNRPRRRNK